MEPITRKEKFLAAAGVQSVDLPTPVTREEVFLKAIAEGGGGGGSDAGTFVCTFTKSGDTISCDKTPAEIDAAYKAGKAVIGIADYSWAGIFGLYGTAILTLERADYNNGSLRSLQFNSLVHLYNEGREPPDVCYVFTLSAIKILTVFVWSVSAHNLLELPTVTSSDNGKVAKVIDGKWTAVDMSPLIVTYTITSLIQPYILTFDHTLAEIAAAYAAGKEVFAQITVEDITFTIPYSCRTASTGIVIASVTAFSNELVNGNITHYIDEEDDEIAVAYIQTIPLYSMDYDGNTHTLAIFD